MVSQTQKYFSLQVGYKTDSVMVGRLTPVLSEFPITAQETSCNGRPLSPVPPAPMPLKLPVPLMPLMPPLPPMPPLPLMPPLPPSLHTPFLTARRGFDFLLQSLYRPQLVETLEE